MERIKKFIESELYNDLIKQIKEVSKIEVQSNCPEMLFSFDKENLDFAKISVDDLESLLNSDKEKIIEYVKIKLIKYLNIEMEQEYPEGYEPDEDDKPVVLKVSPFYKNFLNIYLIEYYLLKNRPTELEAYFKLTRIPGAKKYAKELKEIYSKI
jgi:hypothetical protein